MTVHPTSPSCLSDYDPNALPVPIAQNLILQAIQPINAVEWVSLRQALGRVAAHDVISPIAVPAHDNSAMDGYALQGNDLLKGLMSFNVVGKSMAGHPYHGSVSPGQAVRIMTGAVMPTGCDTVVPQEFTQHDGQLLTLSPHPFKPGDNCRRTGEDLAQGHPALLAGKRLHPADIGLLASLGLSEVGVTRRPRIAFFSTGDELRTIGQPLEPGCVYDSNRYTLHGLLSRLDCDLIDMGVVADHPDSLQSALLQAAEHADAIITTGGVSVGEADFIKDLMTQLGNVAFWKINMRPGRPFAFGHIQSTSHRALLFGLPGNPVSAMVTFMLFVRPALLKLQGAHALFPLTVPAILTQTIRKKTGRAEYMRGIAFNEAGQLHVKLTGAQGSGLLSSVSQANCLITIEQDQSQIHAGDPVSIMLFDGLSG